MIPSHQLLSRIDFFEHVIHTLDVVVIQEPDSGVFVILLEGY